VGVDRREQQSFPSGSSYVVYSYAADATWRPAELPELHLRFAPRDSYDETRLVTDDSTDTAQVSTRYASRGFEARYLLDWIKSTDRLHRVESASVEQTAIVTEADTFLGGRVTTYLGATVQRRDHSTLSTGTGGTVTQLQLPAEGLSKVVELPATSENVKLDLNPAVKDGNTACERTGIVDPACAAVNVGWNSAQADGNFREVGARFADALTDVNVLYLWTDRPLSADAARALATSVEVRTSADNQRWTTPLPATAAASPVQNRIEISIPQTRAKYVKVTLRPIAVGATTGDGFRDLFVTELQLLLVRPVSAVPRSAGMVYATGTAVVRAILLREPNLSYDFSGNVTRQTEPTRDTYALTNGLSVLGSPTPTLALNARGARVDANDGARHDGQWEWSAGIAGRPLPTLSWSLTYNGRLTDDRKLENSGTVFGRAQWWEGISTQASGAGAISTQGLRVTRTVQSTTSTAFAANAHVTLTLGALYSRTMQSDPDIGESWSQFARVDGTLSVAPAPALSATGTVSRVVIGLRPTTYATVNFNYAPLRGDVQLTVAYSETLDTQAEYRTRSFTPSLRWNIRGGTFLTASYALVETSAPVQTTDSRAFTTTLLVVL
jgi:hypothetical protein